VGVEHQVVELVRFRVGDEPQVAVFHARLRRHRARDELSVPAASGEHRGLDAVDEIVELVEFF
jgi:hypothetical protein